MKSAIHLRTSKLVIFFMLFLFLGFWNISALDVTLISYTSLAPDSIPIPQSSTTSIGLINLNVRKGSSGDTNSAISTMNLQLTSTTGVTDFSGLGDVNVYYDGGDGTPDFGSGDDIILATVGTIPANGTMSPSLALGSQSIGWGGGSFYYITVDIPSTFSAGDIDSSDDLGCEITSLVVGVDGVGTGGSAPAITAHGQTGEVDDYEVEVNFANQAPASAEQSAVVEIMTLGFDFSDISEASASADIGSITFNAIGTNVADTDFSSGGVAIYVDNNSDGVLDLPGDTELTTGTISGGAVTLNLAPYNFASSSAEVQLLVTVTIAAAADIDHTIGLEVADTTPLNGSDGYSGIIFSDIIADSYSQMGYITDDTTSLTSVPIDILELTAPDLTQPTLDSSSPANSATGVLTTADIQVNFSEDVTNVDGASVFTVSTGNYNSLGGTPIAGTVSPLTTDPGISWVFDPSSTLSYSTVYYAELTTAITDNAAAPNNMAANAQFSFTTEAAVPPTMDSSSPTDSAAGVMTTTDIQVNFSENVTNIDGASVFTVSTGNYNSLGGTAIAGTVSPLTTDPGLSWVFDPDAALSYSTAYYVELTTAVTDEDTPPNNMAANAQFSFITEAPSPPTIVATYPVSGAVNTSISAEDTIISVTFSETVNNVDTASFTLTDDDGDAIIGTVSGSELTYTLVLEADLSYNTTYTAAVSTAVTDLDGTPMASVYSWYFTTEVEYPDFSEPIVVNNTITPGSSNPTLIFIPEPPGGPDTVMTVNVFTATGKRVVTLVNKISHSEISSPIEWTGLNGLGKQLGPGIYFVEIRAVDYRKTLKIRIVR